MTRPPPMQVKQCLDFIGAVYGAFGFEFSLNLSTRPASSIGATAVWDNAEVRVEFRNLGPVLVSGFRFWASW